jgi:hypothetical protein
MCSEKSLSGRLLHAWVNDRVEIFAGSLIAEHKLAEGSAIQGAVVLQQFTPKALRDLVQGGRARLHNGASQLIRIDDR